jgi:hypothetical protein
MKSIEEIRLEIEAQILRMKESLFTLKYTPDPDSYMNAGIGGDWDVYAMGYKKAGDILVQYVADNDWDQDFLVFPITYLYRQYLELRLKDLIYIGSALCDRHIEILITHDLVKLWRQARLNIEAVWTGSKTIADLNLVEERLKEMCELDNGSHAFRYPEDTKGNPSITKIRYINLKQLLDVIQGISNVLDGASTGMEEYLRLKNEMAAECKSESYYE